jgi:hypothetical protein
MRTVAPRTRQDQEKPEVFRTPGRISDTVYEAFNTLAHKAKLVEGTAVYASRMIREESFTRDQLLEIRDIMTLEAPETEISAEILGGPQTLKWIASVLESGLVRS